MNIDTIIITILGLIILIQIIRIRRRKWFWKDRQGKRLSLKQFIKRYKEGVVNITPLQQTKTTLWSFIPLFAGIIWGIIVMAMGSTWWMVLILGGSLPITSIQFIGNLQKYKAQKKCKEAMDEALGIKPKKRKKK